MRVISEINRDEPRSIYSTVFWVMLIGYFSYYLIQGDRGLLAMIRLEKELGLSSLQLDSLKAQRERLEHKVYLLRPNHLDADLLDEQARRQLGYARSDEVMVLLPPSDQLSGDSK